MAEEQQKKNKMEGDADDRAARSVETRNQSGSEAVAEPNESVVSPNAYDGSGVPVEGDDVEFDSAPADPLAQERAEASDKVSDAEDPRKVARRNRAGS